MEYQQVPEFGCDMEDFKVDEYWKKKAEIYNKQTADEMKQRLEELKKISDKQSYEYLINKYSKILIKYLNLEKGKFYYTLPSDMIFSDRLVFYILDDLSLEFEVFFCSYGNNINGKEIFYLFKREEKVLSNEEKLFTLIDLYRRYKKEDDIKKDIHECKPIPSKDSFMFINGKRLAKVWDEFCLYDYLLLNVYIDKRDNDICFILYFHDLSKKDRNKMFLFTKREELKLMQDKEKSDFFDCITNGYFCNIVTNFNLKRYMRYIEEGKKCDEHTILLYSILKEIGIEFKMEDDTKFDTLIDDNI